MEKDKVFFGEKGITNTQANYVANLAKENYQSIETSLGKLCFYSTTLGLIGSPEQSLLSTGNTSGDVQKIPASIEYIAQCKALIAYLREAIKAREALRREVINLDLETYCSTKGIEMPTYPTAREPLTENDYYGSLSIKERNAYYTLEAECSTLGKYIHPNGSLATARESLVEKMNNPHSVTGTGRDTVIYNYDPTVELSEVEATFFALQNKHRELQAQLNSIKFKCQTAVEASELECQTEYVQATQKYKEQMAALHAEFEAYKKAQEIEIRKLKIVIPDKLKLVYDRISNLGKDN